MGIFKRLKAAVGGVDKDLIKHGVLVRGTVIECRATGFGGGNTAATIEQVCVVTVEISDLPGHPTYRATCHHPIPVIYLAQMKTDGAAVAVRVDPADPQNIALDLATTPPAEHVLGMNPFVQGEDLEDGTSAAPSRNVHRSALTAADILAQGAPCRAVIMGTVPLHQLDSQGLEAVGLVLSVFVDGQAPYQAQIGLGVPPAASALVFPGASLPARVIADRPDMVTIDWPAALAGALP